jgi:dipeptidyl aminopeptidase/acylaminoacyl peptidase
VNYFTFENASPSQDAIYRAARANFNVRGRTRPPGVIFRRRRLCFLQRRNDGNRLTLLSFRQISLVDPANPAWRKSPSQLAPDIKAPVLGLYGEADAGIPVAQVEAMKAALAEARKPAEFKIYPGAPHGFHADYRPSYRKEAADDGWNQVQAWFKKYKVLG